MLLPNGVAHLPNGVGHANNNNNNNVADAEEAEAEVEWAVDGPALNVEGTGFVDGWFVFPEEGSGSELSADGIEGRLSPIVKEEEEEE